MAYKMLPPEDQLSDDFGLLTDGEYFYAVRTEREGSCPFILKHKDKMTVFVAAVHILHEYIESLPEPVAPKGYWDNEQQRMFWK